MHMKSLHEKRYLFVDVHIETAPGVGNQPRLRVYRWRIYQLGGESLLVCEVPETGRIRVTTPIAHLDSASGQLVTDSGRIYELEGSQSDHAADFAATLIGMGLQAWL